MAKKAAEGVTFAFLGTGAMDVDNATDLIEELIDATISSDDDPVRFVFPLTSDEFSDTLGDLVEMAKKSDISYEVITQSGDKPRRNFTDIASTATRTYHVADVYTQMEQILAEAPKAILEVLWDADRETEMTEIVAKFLDAGIDVKDLTDGNTPMAAEEDDEATEIVTTEDGEIVEEETTATDAEVVYTRFELQKMSRNDIKEIAVGLGLPPRKSSAAMITEIMESQGWSDDDEGAEEIVVTTSEEDEETSVTEVEVMFAGNPPPAELVQALDDFPGRIHDVLDQFLTDLGKTIEGVIFNAKPEEPEQAQLQPTRRLTRAH